MTYSSPACSNNMRRSPRRARLPLFQSSRLSTRAGSTSRMLLIAASVGFDSKLQKEHLSLSRLNSSRRASSTSFRSTSSFSELCRELPE